MQKPTAEDLINIYQLEPHPEGGFYRRSYQANESCSLTRGNRPFSTAIFFLLPSGSKSALHRIASDEVWHFYLGDSMSIVQIDPEGICTVTVLGSDVLNGEKLQHVVPAGCWFGALPGGNYSFVGCTVSPGFDFQDFEMGDRQKLFRLYPQNSEWIERLTN